MRLFQQPPIKRACLLAFCLFGFGQGKGEADITGGAKGQIAPFRKCHLIGMINEDQGRGTGAIVFSRNEIGGGSLLKRQRQG